MCWISGKQKIKIAKQDIPIFKIMKETYNLKIVRSYFRGYPYRLNILENIKIKIDDIDDDIIVVHRALHSYSNKMQTEIDEDNNVFVFNTEGVCTPPYQGPNVIKVKGIIPKGSQYMENGRGEFVSNQLILTEICAGLENAI